MALENSRLYAELRAALVTVEESQQRIIRSERLRALGEMAGGVAHDFNNVLAVVVGRAQLLQRQVEAPELRRQLKIIEHVAQDGAQTVRRIQEFARMRRTRPWQHVDVNEVLRLLRSNQVGAALAAYGGDLLPGTDSPALVEFADYVAVAVREALLADPQPQAVARYTELAPYDTEVVEVCLALMGDRPHPTKALLLGRLAAARR